MDKIEFDYECKSCSGTGLYSGMAESKGCAVICHTCKGTGKAHFKFEYKKFTERIESKVIKWVYEIGGGISKGNSNGYRYSDFGGMDYKDWLAGESFEGKEDRLCMCPLWWYQSADYKKKPSWEECNGFGGFSNCDHFKDKRECWAKFDKEKQEALNDTE